jgi:hypothetical protein
MSIPIFAFAVTKFAKIHVQAQEDISLRSGPGHTKTIVNAICKKIYARQNILILAAWVTLANFFPIPDGNMSLYLMIFQAILLLSTIRLVMNEELHPGLNQKLFRIPITLMMMNVLLKIFDKILKHWDKYFLDWKNGFLNTVTVSIGVST